MCSEQAGGENSFSWAASHLDIMGKNATSQWVEKLINTAHHIVKSKQLLRAQVGFV